jgi:two-component system OmpR family sensor kinase
MNAKNTMDVNENQTCEVPERFFHDIKIEFLIHELKTPMALVETAVRSLLEAREIYGALTAKQEKALNRAMRNIGKMRSMVYDLLEIGRSEAGCFVCRVFNPAQVAEEVVVETTQGIRWGEERQGPPEASGKIDWQRFHIRWDVAASATLAQMHQDEVKCRQIISNLVKNALHHRRQWLEIRLTVTDERLRLEVRDDGPGIAPEHQNILFQRYSQVESVPDLPRRGHGLGLAGARILARCLGGDIHVESQINQGATFIVDLPLQFPGQV